MGHATADNQLRWPGGVIPYRINEDDFPPPGPGEAESEERVSIRNAIDTYNSNTRIYIRPSQAGDFRGVEFVAGDATTACSSPVGMQELSISELGRFQKVRCNPAGAGGTLIHEIGHAIGLHHEHQRDNRQEFVNIRWDNVIDDKRHNFKKISGQKIGDYDLGSIMHYREDAFAINWADGKKVRGGQRSSATPALAVLNDEIHMVYKRIGSHDLRHARWTGTAADGDWSDDVAVDLGQQSSTTPALAVVNNELHMVHLGSTGSSRRLWHSRWIPPDLGRWERNQPIAGRESSAAPALAASPDHNSLHMVALGTYPSRTLWHSAWTPNHILGDWEEDREIQDPSGNRPESLITPALAQWGGEIHMVALGGSNTLWHSRWPAHPPSRGIWTEDEAIFSNARRSAPALCDYGSVLHLAYSGTDSDGRGVLRHSDFVGDRWCNYEGCRDDRRPVGDYADNNHPPVGSALAALKDPAGPYYTLFSVFIGDGGRIWYSTRDRTGRTTVAPRPGFSITTGSSLSPGDIATIAEMYP